MRHLFYNRVSSITQNSARQLSSFKNVAPVTQTNLFSDVCSGTIAFKKRDEAIKLWNAATSSSEAVTIVVSSIDRIGRNLRDILATIDEFTEKGISIMFLKEGIKTLNKDGSINQFSKSMIALLGAIAEGERIRIRENQAEGIAAAKLRGVYLENGKKRLGYREPKEKFLSKHKDVQIKLNMGLSYREVRTLTGKSLSTITKVAKCI